MTRSKCTWIVVALLCAVAFFVNNDALVPDIMESRNLVTAREIADGGDWLVPTMNGELRIEKPPLPTWVAGVMERLCPDSLAAQRSAAGVMATLWVLFMYLFAKEISRRKEYALIVTAVFVTMYQVVLMGRMATWDVYCHAFMMGAVYFLWRGFYDERFYVRTHTMRWFGLAGVMLGLSFLSKGPVSFYALLLPFLITAFCFRRPSMRGKWKAVTLMVVIFLAVSSWWYACLLMTHHGAVLAVLHKESGAWVSHNVRPWYYYWRFFTETGAWTLLILAALFVPYWSRRISMKRQYRFSMLWTVAALVLLSLMPEKKTRYLLPMMVPCSLVVACLLQHFIDSGFKERVSRMLFCANGAVVSLITIALPVVVSSMPLRHTLTTWQMLFTGVVLPGLGIWIAYSILRYNVVGFLYGLLAVFAVSETVLLGNIGAAFGNPEMHSVAEVRYNKELSGIPFYHPSGEPLRIEMVYAAGRKILPLDLGDTASVMRSLPCVVVSRKPLSGVLSAGLSGKIDTIGYGVFDDNRHPRSDKHYTEAFINHLTLLKKKDKK